MGLPISHQAQFDLVPLALDERAVQMPISITRHDPIRLDHERLVNRRIVRRWLVGCLDVSDGCALHPFQFGAGGFGVGAQCLGSDLHAS